MTYIILIVEHPLECPAAGEAITRQTATALAGFQSILYGVICGAQTLGQLSPGQDPLALSHFFATLTQGLGVMSKQSADLTVLRNIVEVALRVFEPRQPSQVRLPR